MSKLYFSELCQEANDCISFTIDHCKDQKKNQAFLELIQYNLNRRYYHKLILGNTATVYDWYRRIDELVLSGFLQTMLLR